MATNKPNMTLEVWAGGSDNQGNGNVIAENDPLLAPKMTTGFTAEIPTYNIFNYPLARADQFAHHINENGFPVWDALTPYSAKAWVKDPTDGEIYISKIANQGQQPLNNSPTKWELRSTFLNGDIHTNSIDNNGAASITFNGNDVTEIASLVNSGGMTLTAGGSLRLNGSNVIADQGNFQVHPLTTNAFVSLKAKGQLILESSSVGSSVNINSTAPSAPTVNIGTSTSNQTLNIGKSNTQGNTRVRGATVDIDAGTLDIDATTARLNGSNLLSVSNCNTSLLSTDNKDLTGTGYIQVTNDFCIAFGQVQLNANETRFINVSSDVGAPSGFEWRIISATPDTTSGDMPLFTNAVLGSEIAIKNLVASSRTYNYTAHGVK